MSTHKKPMGACLAAVFALGLAGCGGGGGGSGSAADLALTVYQAEADAERAAREAAEAVDEAVRTSLMLTTMSVNGESLTAVENARKILDARAAVEQAIADAEAALATAEEGRTKAQDLADDEQKATVIVALDDAIEAARESLREATAARDDNDFAMAVEAVTGRDEEMPMTPADIGTSVAMEIAAALAPDPRHGEGTPMGVFHTSDPIFPDPSDRVLAMDDHQGRTWAEIVGEDALEDRRIAAPGRGTMIVKAATFADMTLYDIADYDNPPPHPGADVADGRQWMGRYRGFDGTIFCAGPDCRVSVTREDEDPRLVGSWYFTPADSMESYVPDPDGPGYVIDTLYTRFGYWLSWEGYGGATEFFVNTYAMTSGNTSDIELGADDALAGGATYEGTAVGMSVHKTLDEDGRITSIESGAFEAEVSLHASFGDVPTLGGTISDFEGNAVDETWTVELEETQFADHLRTVGYALASDDPVGTWTATAYGVRGQRPTGIFGHFNANFSDGNAAGAYAVRER